MGEGNTISSLNVALEGICVCFFVGHWCAFMDQAFKTPMDCTSDNGLVANEGEVFLTTTTLMDVEADFLGLVL